MELVFKRVELNEDNIYKLEYARYDAYSMLSLEIPCNQSFCANELRKKKYIAYAAYLDDEIIGGCYVSNAHKLYIEQLFVKKKYQSLHVGRTLLAFTLHNKEEIEKYFNETYDYSFLSTRSNKLNKYYEELGYKNVDDIYMKKHL